MKLLTLLLLLLVGVLIAKPVFFGFRAQKPADYAGTEPAFILEKHLSGPIVAEGIVYGPLGKVTNSFVAQMQGAWADGKGTLAEDFTYSNGASQTRNWTLTKQEGNRFTATAPDVVGEAEGVVSGSTVRLIYKIILPEASGGYTLSATDWMYLAEDGVILNKSEMRMWGIKVAELVATMRPAQTAD
ncbi:DUF3833 domain-containing protein [Epibacterium ulvae]|uniref:DUF3833 domain-containing protein n=1 Tax=Epibacterium ulvae TaxID=1156985 RepID=A0A1G5R519_9RHOB|nr:DUF3833 domain-containing protein [Epibacterium ulvae]SCZ69056.1 Protein of unknown function [Epibacterium ulvae]